MKFSDKFTDEELRSKSIIRVNNKKPCHICGENTRYIDFCYETRICSTECQGIIDKECSEYSLNLLDEEEEK